MTDTGVPYLEIRGQARQMGRQHGEHFREKIGPFAERRLATCRGLARLAGNPITRDDVLDFCRQLVDIQADRMPTVHEEFLGITEGADIDPALLMIGNGLTDIVDWFVAKPTSAGCTACLIDADATTAGTALAAQTWDMHPYARENVIVLARRPADGPDTLCVTTTGCLNLAGINQAGLAIGNNNLHPTDAKPGVMYLAIIHHALTQRSLAGAINIITAADRLSGHNYYLLGPDNQYVNVETTGELDEVIEPAGAFYVHANHFLMPRLREREHPEDVNPSTTYRLDRMGALLHEHVGEITVDTLKTLLADNGGQGECNICRSDPADTSNTCAAVILEPDAGAIHVAAGPPDRNPFTRFTL